MPENNEKTFDLGSVLTVTSGRIFTEMDNVLDIVNYLSDDRIFTNKIPIIIEAAQPYVLARYPQLSGVGKDVVINSREEAKAFVDSQREALGDSFALSPMPKEMYDHLVPSEEKVEVRSGKTR